MQSSRGWKATSQAEEKYSSQERQKNKENLQRYFAATAYFLHVVMLVVVFMSLTQFMDLQPEPLMWAAAAAVIFFAAITERYRRFSAWMTGLLTLSVLVFFLFGLRRWPHLIMAVWEFMSRWLQFLHQGYLRTLTSVPADLGYFTAWLVLLLLGIWGFALIRRKKPWPILIVGVGVLSFQWFFHFDAAEVFLRSYLAAAIPLIAVLQGIRWLGNTHALSLTRFSPGAVLRWVALLTALTMLLSLMLPVQPATWRLTTVRRWITETFPLLQQLRGGTGGPNGRPIHTFSLQSSGYGASDRLGGPLSLDESPAFHVILQPATIAVDELPFPLYMRGRTLAQYTGRGWTAGENESWEWFESGERLPRLYSGNVSTRSVAKTFTSLNLSTGSVFSSGDLREVTLPEPLSDADEGADGTIAKSNRGDVLAHQRLGSEMEHETQTSIPFWGIDAEQLAVQEDEESHQTDLQPYLQVPDRVPQRVKQLAEDVAGDRETDYSKAQAVRDYLRELPYSTDVAEVPDDREFTDFFLFDEQAGYCTYHSTAMAVMLRMVGVPTRWVKGFVLREQQLQPLEDEPGDSARQATVSLSSAHAWVEVWIEGKGWVLFEPTPLYSSIAHDRQPPERETADVGEGPSEPADDVDRPLDPMDQELIENGYPRTPRRPLWSVLLLRILGGLVAAVFLLGVGTYAVSRWQEHSLMKKNVNQMLDDDRYHCSQTVLMATSMARFAVSRYMQLDSTGLTLREFAGRVSKEFQELGEVLHRLADLYEPVAYGGLRSSASAALLASHLLESVMRCIRREVGLITYALMRCRPIFSTASAPHKSPQPADPQTS